VFHIHIRIEGTSAIFTLLYPRLPLVPSLHHDLVLHSCPLSFQWLFFVHWGFALVFYLKIYCTLISLTPLLLCFTLSPTLYCSTVFNVFCSYTDVMYFSIIHYLFSFFPPLLVFSNSPTIGNIWGFLLGPALYWAMG
jgi:hypothetical protein